MKIISEVRTALDLMRYAKNNSDKFKSKGMVFPFMVSLMKFVGGISTELLSIYIIV